MAAQVAQWPSLYKCDGIDLDLEQGAGDQVVIQTVTFNSDWSKKLGHVSVLMCINDLSFWNQFKKSVDNFFDSLMLVSIWFTLSEN